MWDKHLERSMLPTAVLPRANKLNEKLPPRDKNPLRKLRTKHSGGLII